MDLVSINPATGEVLQHYPETPPGDLATSPVRGQEAFEGWRRTSFDKRARLFRRLAGLLKKRKENLARLATAEMGKPILQARSEIEKCAWACEFYAQHAARFLRDEEVKIKGQRSSVSFQPLGVVLAIMPWNFPFWQVFRFGVPALAAGNAFILKHAPHVSGCAKAIFEIFMETGFPEHLLQVLFIAPLHVDAAVSRLIECPEIQAVTVTGSTRAGRTIAAKAGQAIKKTVLELGGSDAYLLLRDADVQKAVQLCVTSRLSNSGQSCIAAKRIIAPKVIFRRVLDEIITTMQKKKLGDPMDENTEVGPLARQDLRDSLHQQVQKSIALGATVHVGGEIPAGPGWFYPPTVLSDVQKGMPAYDEELFGPVAVVMEARDEKDAIRIANDTRFGLGSGVFSKNTKRAFQIARNELQSGCAFVNAIVQSDPRLPFGGIKESGYGRELGKEGIREFVNRKTLCVRPR